MSKRSATSAPAASSSPTKKSATAWSVPRSNIAERTINPIRDIVDQLVMPKGAGPDDAKPLLKLSIGDPTVFGNLDTHKAIAQAVADSFLSGKHNGYNAAHGMMQAREAVAARVGVKGKSDLTANDVIIANGASGALAIALPGLCGEGDNILIPAPCFSLYITIAQHYNIETKQYKLLSDKAWECDIAHMESLIDSRTRAILVNNPGNPTGSNYSAEHLAAVVALAAKHKLPIVSDEIYGDMVWSGPFTPIASLTTEVPVLAISGISKQQLVPGWRLGWMTIHDRHDRLKSAGITAGLLRLSQVVLGASVPIQAALPRILDIVDASREVPQSFYDKTRATLQSNATFLYDKMQQIAGVRPVVPQGAMYLMVEVVAGATTFKDGTSFAQALLDEEHVFVLPGSCFSMPQFFRVVTAPPLPVLKDAIARIESFCKRHAK